MLISTAYAQSAGSPTDAFANPQFLFLIALFVGMYFVVLRPQMKRAKEARTMIESLKKGDEVVTSGGVVGKITKLSDAFITLEVSRSGGDSIEMNFQRAAVSTLLPNGTIKSI